MSSSEPQSEAERTALKVFHDLQLAHVRRQEGADEPSAESSGETSTAGATGQSTSGLSDTAASPERPARGPL
jgi:hypothetical protein